MIMNMKTSFALVLTALAVPAFADLRFSPYVQPAPVEMNCVSNVAVKLDASQTVTVCCGEAGVEAWAAGHLRKWYGKDAPKVVTGAFSSVAPKGDEAYELDATPDGGIVIRAPKAAGVRYALFTLRQLAMPARGTVTVQGWILPEVRIKDAPALAFRGMHVSWIKEYDATEMERLVRMAAYCKFNRVVLENWGAYHSKKYPWWGYADGGMDAKTIAHLVAVAREEGVELIPQVQIFGHASLCRSTSAKHAILDAHPEYAPLFEPDAGWNWCLTNPNARRIILDLIDEMWEAYGKPKYFHLGCDEAYPPSCPTCMGSDYRKVLVDHIGAIVAHLREKGVKSMMWHDMYLLKGDERWKGFYANGDAKLVAAMEEGFPRDIVICDWFYGDPPKDRDYPTLKHFKDLGFTVLTCPWFNPEGSLAQGEYARKHGIDGMLVTVWHYGFGNPMKQIFTQGAFAAWGTPFVRSPLWPWGQSDNVHFNTMLREVTTDAGAGANYEATGVFRHQVAPKSFYKD